MCPKLDQRMEVIQASHLGHSVKKVEGVIKIRLSSKHNEIESDTKQMQQKSDSLGETKLNFLEPRFYWS